MLLFSGILLFGCTSFPVETNKSNSYLMYNNEIYGFSMQYPKTWSLQENFYANVTLFGQNIPMNAIVVLYKPIQNNFRTNINIIVENTDLNISEYALLAKQSLPIALKFNNFIQLNEKNLTISNNDAYFLEYAYNKEGYAIKVKQVYIIHKDRAYVITYTSLQNNFNESIDEFNEIINSFKFIN